MAAATLNDVTNSLMLLNVEQGNTTEAVKSLVKRVQDMLDFDKRKALDDAEATREASRRARSRSQGAGATAPRTGSFGIGDALLAGAFLTVAALNEEISAIIDSAKDNLLKFVNDIQKIFFTINQGLITLSKFINTQIFSRIGNLILDIRTNPRITKSITVIEDSVKFVVKVIDETLKFISKTFKIISGAFTFIGSILRVPLALISNGVSEAVIAASKLNPVFKFFKGIGRIFGKLFLPLTIFITAWDTIKGAVDGFKEKGIVGGLEGAVDGFFNSLIFMPLEMIFDATAWLLSKLGFPKTAEKIGDFNPTEVFDQITDIVFQPIYDAVEWIKTAFTDPSEALRQLWRDVVGEGGLIDIMWWPVNLAVNKIKEIFNLGDPNNPFRMGAFIEGLIIQTVDIFAQIFNKFMNMLRSIPIVKDFFKSEEEKILIERKAQLQKEITEQERFLRMLEDDTKSVQTFIRSAGDPEVLGIRGLGKTPEQKEALRETARQRLQARRNVLANLSSDRRLIEIARAQSAQKLALAEQNLSVMQSAGSAPIIVAPSSTSSTSNVNQRFDLGMPSAADRAERLTVD